MSHQGRVAVNGLNFDGSGQFKFALVNANGSTTYWSNAPDTSPADGEPDGAVLLTVTKGLYSVMLGDASLPNMNTLPAAVFANADLRLRVWFNNGTLGFQQLSPDQRIAPNGYLPDGVISSGKLADRSITSAKIAAGTAIPSQSVSGASHTMVANAKYAVSGDTPMTLTLPISASVGDTVEVSGVGTGKWSVVPGNGQGIVPRWTPQETSRQWTSIASSADGSKLVAGVNGGYLYTSTDSGMTWTARDGSRPWSSLACSADGTKIFATTNPGAIYTSTDSGVTWTPNIMFSFLNWASVASSADGSKLLAASVTDGLLTSTNSGATWTWREDSGSPMWITVASSADGTKLVAAKLGGQIYTSTDSGITWAPRESNRNWRSLASSADGNKLVAVVEGGQIYTSTDSGITWSPRENNRSWSSIASSADGSKLVASVYGGQLYTSIDSGDTWTSSENNRNWRSVAISSDGSKLVAAVYGGRIYTSGSAIYGGQGQSASLQYLGNGQWVSLAANELYASSLTGSVPSTALTSVPASSLTGSVPSASLTSVPAASLTGPVPPASLTSVPASSLTGAVPPASLTSVPAASLTGTISDAQLSSNVPLRAGGNSFTGNQTVMGNVGIGTAVPGQMLQVGDVNTGNSLGMMRFASRSGTGPANRYWDIGVPQAGENAAGKYFSFVIDDPQLSMEPEVVVRFDTGNMGIGVTSPASRLHVNGTVTATAFNPPSDRNLKENFKPVDAREVLEKVASIPISRWNFIGDAGTPHIGPMAQDFHAAFGTGTDDRHIATVDADGVALAAIQGLNEKLTEALTAKETEIAALKSETGALREKNQAMEARLAALEALLNRQQAARSKSHYNPSAP
jgi:hypothetical protein